MKALEFIYQDTQIAFVLGNEKNVMVNATEMAKAFGKRTKDFLANQSTKDFIFEVEQTLKSVRSENNQTPNGAQIIIDNRGHMGIYFERRLALKFAAWLDVKFEVWIYNVIDDILFGSAKAVGKKLTEKEKAKKELDQLIMDAYEQKNEFAINLLNKMQEVKNLEKETNKEFSNLKKQYTIFD
jgi:hypothetical protein